jgi:site-specific recombinase XerD
VGWQNSSPRQSIQILISLIGNTQTCLLDKTTALKAKECLQRLPAHYSKKKQYKDKSLAALTKMAISEDELMSIRTINMKLSLYAELFNWAISHNLAEQNPFKSVQIKDKRNTQLLRLPSTNTDLIQIFSAPQLTNAKKPHHYWLPILALYTGARINELCQIYTDDIQEIENISCIKLTDKRSDQSLKKLTVKE